MALSNGGQATDVGDTHSNELDTVPCSVPRKPHKSVLVAIVTVTFLLAQAVSSNSSSSRVKSWHAKAANRASATVHMRAHV